MHPTRRIFLRGGALAVVGTTLVPRLLTRAVLAQTASLAAGKRLVIVFQRGAADGLNIVVPYREPNYYRLRPTLAIPPNQLHDLDGFFGLHPALASLQPLWSQRQLAIVHACGSPNPTRSHFDAQDYMESGTPGIKSTPDGWLNRALAASPAPASAFRAIAMGPSLPRTLSGPAPAIAIADPSTFAVHDATQAATQPPSTQQGREAARAAAIDSQGDAQIGAHPDATPPGFAAMYADSVNTVLHGTAKETFEAVRMLRSANPAQYQPAHGAAYPRTPFGQSMLGIAQLLKSNLGVQVAFAESGGWDTHQNQGGATGQLANRLRELADSLAAFHQDLGPAGDDVVLVTMSEFGRTAAQNGTGGTDHGHANAMLVLGAPVRGGKVYGTWPGLADGQLNENRDLQVTTDFRQVLSEAAASTLHPHSLQTVFPGISLPTNNMLGILNA